LYRLIISAALREHLRWARGNLYSLLVLSPLVLGLSYFGLGELIANAAWEPPRSMALTLAVASAAALILLSMSRAGVELYHLRRPEALFDSLPLTADAHLAVALFERILRTTLACAALLLLRRLFGLPLNDALVPVIVLVLIISLAEIMTALLWIHWWQAREASIIVSALALLGACAFISGALILMIVNPEKLSASWRLPSLSAALLMSTVLFFAARWLHRKWRPKDLEQAKRLQSGRSRGFASAGLQRILNRSAAETLLQRDLTLTIRAFSSAVYAAVTLALVWISVLAALIVNNSLPVQTPGSLVEATWLPTVVAVKVASVLAVITLASLTPVLVEHQRPHLWLERAAGTKGEDIWRAKLWFARVISLPAPMLAWTVGLLSGATPAAYALPLLAETIWLWWLVSTLAGALAFEVPDQPGLAVILIACAGLAAGLFVSIIWPAGFALYAFGIEKLYIRGEHRARFHLLAEAE
jgi:hypothetical protein